MSSSASVPAVYTIPPHRAFADALTAGLMRRFGGSPTGLARGLLLVPNNRAARAITDAFVRRAEGGLLLPRIVPIGDPELDERIGGALEPLGAEAVPPAIAPELRLMLLARLLQRHQDVDAAEALRLAADLGRTLDQLLIEEVRPERLREFAAELPDLSLHWQTSLDRLALILDQWPRMLASRGRIDLADRRNRLLEAAGRKWRGERPGGFVAAVGITTAAPAVARLLGTVARLPDGLVVLPGLDGLMPDEDWEALGPFEADPVTGRRRRAVETHPQYQLKLLLDRMSVGRGEVRLWRWGGGRDSPAVRSRAIGHAMAPAASTGRWQTLRPAERRLTGVRALEVSDPAEEAQVIALALRQAVERPGRTAALVTPDRGLARRVSAHLRRWGIEADDSAGRPLGQTAPGTLLTALAQAGAEQFSPVTLLTLLKHPLVRRGPDRLAWLEGARSLDLALRGPRPPAGLDGVTLYLADEDARNSHARRSARGWWRDVLPLLRPLEQAFAQGRGLAALIGALRDAATALAGDEAWAGQAGRCAADLVAAYELAAEEGPDELAPGSLAALLDQLMAGVAVRPPYGQHPRIFIWGLIEARLQSADLMILAGLNEGTWPALPQPDPWLAPRLRSELGLPGLERRIGVNAHDFAMGLGGREVLVTRARRDARSPSVASRFWLRLEAMTGGLTREPNLCRWARIIDRPAAIRPAARPQPSPPVIERPRLLSVTEVDRLKADPFAFYARKLLRLGQLDPIDADPSPAWRGTAVHDVLDRWMKEDGCDPAKLRPRAEAFLAGAAAHPLMRAFWQPRLLEAIDWIAEEMDRMVAIGRRPLAAEAQGSIGIDGITLKGVADRIDLCADGSLAIVDYKTGNPPSRTAVFEGYSLQLGLLGLIAEENGIAGVTGKPSAFEYWSLAKKNGRLGYVATPISEKHGVRAEDFTTLAKRNLQAAAAHWLTGDAPFTAKLHPEYAPFAEYDQLMRLEEWYGREEGA